MNLFIQIVLLIVAYLLGSIPFGFIIGKLKGVDIREHGSKNLGSTNVGRVLGRRYAVLTYILDMIKGALFVFLFRFDIIPNEYCFLSPMTYGLAASIGHSFSIYLNFKGGKSVATSSGAIFGYSPLILAILLVAFAIVVLISRYISLGSITGAISGLIISIIFFIIGNDPFTNLTVDFYFPLICFIMLTLIIYRHRENIKRLRNNSENKIKI